MPGSLKSSINLPQPRTRRDSSLRTMGRPTQPGFLTAGAAAAADTRGTLPGARCTVGRFFLATTRFFLATTRLSRRLRCSGVERGFQSVDQLLNVFLGERLQQPARHGDDPPKHL